MLDKQDREVAMSRPENEVAIAEMLNHPKCRAQKLPEYVGVCVDASGRVYYCTAFKADMVTLEEFAETESMIYKDLALDIYKLIWHGVKTLHAQGIPHGAIYQNNVYLSWERRRPEGPNGMPSEMVTKVVLGKFGRFVALTTGRNYSEIDLNSAMRADRLCRRGVLHWMESMMLLEE
jgi:serine/threonine protein kinase